MSEPTRLRWWFEDPAGQIVIAQRPNASALTTYFAFAVARLPVPVALRRVASGLSHLAAATWAADEIVRGTTPARRVTGAAALSVQTGYLLRSLRATCEP